MRAPLSLGKMLVSYHFSDSSYMLHSFCWISWVLHFIWFPISARTIPAFVNSTCSRSSSSKEDPPWKCDSSPAETGCFYRIVKSSCRDSFIRPTWNGKGSNYMIDVRLTLNRPFLPRLLHPQPSLPFSQWVPLHWLRNILEKAKSLYELYSSLPGYYNPRWYSLWASGYFVYS